MKRRSRRYAKRQLTWLRRMPGAELVDVGGPGADEVGRELAERLG
jgi:tRNA dimethylallyltransferase